MIDDGVRLVLMVPPDLVARLESMRSRMGRAHSPFLARTLAEFAVVVLDAAVSSAAPPAQDRTT